MMGERYWSRDLHWIAFNKKIWTKRQARRVCVKKEQRFEQVYGLADAGDAEPGIRIERRAMVHAAFAHPDDDDRILFHLSALSHSIAFATT